MPGIISLGVIEMNNVRTLNKRGITRTKMVVTVGIFSAIAFILQLIGSFIGLKVGGFLEIEFSDIPALIVALAYGPLSGILVELVKNVLHCAVTSTGFVGEFANFVINGILCFTAGIIYKKYRTYKGAIIALFIATVMMSLAGILVNRYIMLPLYMPDAPKEVIYTLVMGTILPFNIVKGLVISLITVLLYKRISKIIK